jgi:predicted amidophosphoribosyltransferase
VKKMSKKTMSENTMSYIIKTMSKKTIWKIINTGHVLCPLCRKPFLTSKRFPDIEVFEIRCRHCGLKFNFNPHQELKL